MKEHEKKPKSKARKIIEWIGTIILGIVFVFAAVCNGAKLLGDKTYGYGNSFGYGTYVVLTDSMEPVYEVNSAIITYKEKPENIVKEWNEIKDLNLEMTDERNINLTFVDAYEGKVRASDTKYFDQTANAVDMNGQPMVMTHQLFEVRVNENVEEGNGRYLFFVHGINISEHQSGEGQYQVFTENQYLGQVKINSKFVGGISQFLSSVWGLLICLLIPCIYIVISSVLDLVKAYKMDDDEEEGAVLATEPLSMDNISKDDYEKLKQQMIQEILNGKGEKK